MTGLYLSFILEIIVFTLYHLYNIVMKVVNLADRQGNVKQKRIGFSFAYFFFGPFYLFAKARILLAIFILGVYYYLLPIRGMNTISNFILDILNISHLTFIKDIFMFFRGEYTMFIGIGIVIILHIFIAIFIEGYLLKKLIKKKKLLPVTEDDARILISLHACSTKIELASTRLQNEKTENDYLLTKKELDLPYIINEVDNSKIATFKRATMRKKIEELNELYSLNQITREEYEIRRAKIKEDYK